MKKLFFLLPLLLLALLVGCTTQPDEPSTPSNETVIEGDGYTLTIKGTVLTKVKYTVPGAAVRVTVPEGVTEIGYEAFYGCGHIKTFYFPHSLQYIAYSAILNCAYIEQAHYNGTVEEWTAIDKHSGWNLHAYQFPIHCTNGTAYCR